MTQTSQFTLPLPPVVETALCLLEQAGFEAYAVGGCVRDALLGKIPQDWDITTSALPAETQKVFSQYPTIETGLKHGTLTVLLDNQPIEITTYRVEAAYSDHRHPDDVVYTKQLQQDLSRRDFTINAMAYHPQLGFIDLFGGQEDLRHGVIRAVGQPAKRFEEDALRIMRALRFAAVLGFQIEPETAACLVAAKKTLTYVAPERLQAELNTLLCGSFVYPVLHQYGQVLAVLLPELLTLMGFEQHNQHHIYDVYEHTIHTVAAAPADLVLRLTMLLHDLGKPASFQLVFEVGHFYGHANQSEELAQAILQRLKYSNEITEAVLPLVKYHDVQIEADEYAMKRWLNRKGEIFLRRLIQVKRADNQGQAPAFAYRQTELDQLEAVLNKVLAEGQCFHLKDLAVNGKDLQSIGFQQGKTMGIILNALLEAVLQNDLPNQKAQLLKRASFYLKQSTYLKP